MLSARVSEAGDPAELAPKLRLADVAEVRAGMGCTPLQALTLGYEASAPCISIINGDGAVVGMFGINQMATDVAAIWMLAADELTSKEHRSTFLRNSRVWVNSINSRHQLLFNHVDARNKQHIRWLKWCGFSFIRLVPDYGAEKRPFYEFVRLHNV